MSDDLAALLQRYLSQRSPGAGISAFQFLASGVESDIYTFTYHPPKSPAQALILRTFPGDGAAQKLLREANGVLRLQQAGYPVAPVLYSETDPALLGRPFTVMEKLEGKVLWPLLYQVGTEEVGSLLDRFGRLIAWLHRLDWRPFTDQAARYAANPTTIQEDNFAWMRQLYAQFGVEGFLRVVDWLEAHQAQITVQPAVVHLDFHANNVFLCDDGRLAVIDWTQITVADYRSDLTWTLMIMGDFGQPHWRERILQAYAQEAGRPVENLDYFGVITDTKLLASTIISLKTSLTALGMRSESSEPADQQAATIQRLYRRIQDITRVIIPEVEKFLIDNC